MAFCKMDMYNECSPHCVHTLLSNGFYIVVSKTMHCKNERKFKGTIDKIENTIVFNHICSIVDLITNGVESATTELQMLSLSKSH